MIRVYPCRCCGFLTLSDPGVYEICPVCFWEDDPVQNEDSSFAGGANRVTLDEARRNFVEFGAAELGALKDVRSPSREEVPRPPMLQGLEPELRAMRERTVRVALLSLVRSVRAGHMPMLEGCTAIAMLSWPLLSGEPTEESLRTFDGVASEIDDMPIGEEKNLWSAAALAEADLRMAEYEATVRPSVIDACDRLEAKLLAELTSSTNSD